MATTAFSFSSLRPVYAGARSKPRGNPKRKTPSKKPNSNSITTTSSSNSQPFVLPTTYTRLPLMDDDISSDSFPMEITIDEFSALGKKPKKKGPPAKKNPSKKSINASRFVQEILDEEEEEDINIEEDEIFLDPGFDMKNETNITEFGKELEDEEEGEIEDGKDKGVPAVMRCFDTAKIYAKAGDGGNGVVAFRREKFVPYGGPSGGDGGQGGHIYLEVDPSMNSLLPFRKTLHFRAGRGRHGQGSKQAGARGEDVVVLVPRGTVVREATKGKVGEGEVLMELLRPGQRALLLPGGRGGRGNASFRSGNNKIPKIAERGEEGAEMWLDLELKLVADVGIVGAPNAGKSTFLSAITAAEPEIANYPFTTLLPNLGVVSLDFDVTMVVADLPGLLEGAHRGYGLGHEFLRHSERCSVLVHVVDGSAEQPEYEFDAVRLELELFSPALAEKPYIVLFNKMDLPEAFEKWESFRENLQSRGFKPYCISALNKQGTYEIACTAYELLQKERREKKEIEEWQNPQDLNHVADAIKRERSALMSDFEIIHENNSNKWHVVGAGIQRFVQMTNWRYSESLRRFQHALEACGVYKALTKKGVKEGDIVIVGEMEMIWHDEYEKESSARSSKRDEGMIKAKSSKRDEGTIRWPEFG